MSKPIRYRKIRICKDLLFQSLRYTKSKYLFFQIHSDLLKIDERVNRVLNGRAQFGWTLTESHTTIIIQSDQFYHKHLVYQICNQRHRNKDQPAIIHPDGLRVWYNHGKKHRDGDQPAVIYPSGGRRWYKHGLQHRDGDQPAVIHPNGTLEWYKHDLLHRDGDQPAYIRSDGTQRWYKYDLLHRDEDQPAIILPSGARSWWIDGTQIKLTF